MKAFPVIQRFPLLVAAIICAALFNGGCAFVALTDRGDAHVRLDKNVDTRMVPSLEMARMETANNPLYQKLVNGFTLPEITHHRVRLYREKYSRHPLALQDIIDRSEPFLAYIAQQVEKRGLPMELALLPIVESGYDPLVKSPSGAAGLWQIVPATGRSLGLVQNRWFDGRLDVVEATDAALNYLTQLYRKFDRDWLLALAAYNAGQGNLSKAIRSNRAAGRSTDYFSLPLRRETRAFVPKLLAIRDLFREPLRYYISLNLPDETIPFTHAMAGRRFSLDAVFASCTADKTLISLLNAGLIQKVSPEYGPHRVRIPHACREGFVDRLAARLNSKPVKVAQAPQPHIHKVRRGDSLWSIARAYRVTVAGIARWNRIAIDSTLRLGQKLLIYSN